MIKEDGVMNFTSIPVLAILALIFISLTGSAAQAIEIKGAVTDLGIDEFTWNAQNFAGFYYDIEKNLGTEQITLTTTQSDGSGAVLSSEDLNGNRGVVYTTTAQMKNFKFKPWGSYKIIGFLGEPYFAGYSSSVTPAMEEMGTGMAFLYDKSKSRNLMTNEQISKVLIDDNTEMLITSTQPLMLKDGYTLSIKSVNSNETRAIVELKKDGQSIDSKMVLPGIENAVIADQSYYYRSDIGKTQGIVTIAIHFKNLFRGDNENNSATVDGIFQISEKPTLINADQQYDKMRIRTVDSNAMVITMDNKDNQIVLSRNKDILLMENIHIKTADQSDTSTDNPLRFYICKEVLQ
jgi:S-layer protein (TIGR01567 family)